MADIGSPRIQDFGFVFDSNPLLKCKFGLVYPPKNSREEFALSLKQLQKKEMKESKIKPVTKTSCLIKKQKFQNQLDERKKRAELRKKKMIQKIKKIYKINIDDFKDSLINQIIMKVNIIEKEKKEREKMNLEKTLRLISRLLQEQKLGARDSKIRHIPKLKKQTLAQIKNFKDPLEIEELNKTEGSRSHSIFKESTADKKLEFGLNEIDTEKKEETSELPKCLTEDEFGVMATQFQMLSKNLAPVPTEKHLDSTPRKIIFLDYEKNKVYLQDLKITNIGFETIHCRYLGIAVRAKTEGRFPVGVAVRDNVILRPGLSCSTKVRLYSEDNSKEFECSVVYETRKQNKALQHSWFFVPVVCVPAKAVVKITPLKIVFPSLTWCFANGPEGRKILKNFLKIENSGGRACSCKITAHREQTILKLNDKCSKEDTSSIEGTEGSTKSIHSTVTQESRETFFKKQEVFKWEEYSGENEFISDYEVLEFIKLLMSELVDNVFATFRFSEKYFIHIDPFSTKKVEVKFQPEYKGFHHENYFLQFEECSNCTEEKIELMGDIKPLPVTADSYVIDLKTCIINSGVYSGTFRLRNESKGPFSVKLKVPLSLKNHAHVYPKTMTIQSLISHEFSIRIYPRLTLAQDAPKFYKEDSGVLEFPIFIYSANTASCKMDHIKIYVLALITNCTLELSPPVINFGTVTTLETVRTQIQLTNHSLAIQEFAFLSLPKGIRIEPNMGFGLILPKETIILDLLFHPETDLLENKMKLENHVFDVTVTSTAEFGGLKEKQESETKSGDSFEGFPGESLYYEFKTVSQNSKCPCEERESMKSEESEDDICEEENFSEEEAYFKGKKHQKEIKIRKFLKQEGDKLSEHSFFERMNLQAKDYDVSLSGSFKDIVRNHNENFNPNIFRMYSNVAEEIGEVECTSNNRSNANIIKCTAVLIEPFFRMSESVVQLPATPCSSVSLYRFRIQSDIELADSNYSSELRNTKKNNLPWKDSPKSEVYFEFQYFCPQIKLEPQSGHLQTGDSLAITVVYKPELPAKQLRHESRIQKAKEIVRNKKTEGKTSTAKVTSSAKSKQKISQSSHNKKRSADLIDGDEIEEIINISLYELEKYDLFAGERSLQELINPFFIETKIQCIIKTTECGDQKQRTEVHQLIMICPAIKPNFIYMGSSQEIKFDKVFVGTRPKVVLQLQNISFERISPIVSLLNPGGSFFCLGGLNKVEVDPEHVWRQPLTYAPTLSNRLEKEYFEIYCGSTNIFLTVSGESVEPQYKLIPFFKYCLFEAKPGNIEELKIEIENLSSIKLKIKVATDFLKEFIEVPKEEEKEKVNFLNESKKEKMRQKEDSKDKKQSKNTESEKKTIRFWDEIPKEVLLELKSFTDVEENQIFPRVFTLVGVDDNNEILIAPFGKSSMKIRFSSPIYESDTKNFDKKYAVKYNVLLEGIHLLNEILIVGLNSKRD